MTLLIQQIINGLITGSSFALLALGLVVIFGVMHIPNFSIGAVFVLGAFIAYYTVIWFGPSYYLLSLLPIILIGGLIGILSYKLVFAPLRNAHPATGFIAALGLYYIMEGGWNVLFGTQWRMIRSPYSEKIINVFGIFFTWQSLLIFIICTTFALIIHMFMMNTSLGKKIRAASENADAAALLGISLNKVCFLVFGIGTALAGIAGTIIAPTYLIGATVGMNPIVKAFIVTVLGGMGSIQGAIIGGLLLGVVESLGASYISSMYKELFPFGVFLLILMFKPNGLFQR